MKKYILILLLVIAIVSLVSLTLFLFTQSSMDLDENQNIQEDVIIETIEIQETINPENLDSDESVVNEIDKILDNIL